MINGEIKKFDCCKNFRYIRKLGDGGTGDTYLFKDESTDMLFAIKKYRSKDLSRVDEFYDRFVQEIKILFHVSHPNIVRIFNYYLYPSHKTGYLQMEYIDGIPINEFKPIKGVVDWNDIFNELISAFSYLEQHHILHRDIRPANILIDTDNHVKIIDFGFGKIIDSSEADNSIFLNWPVSRNPDEVVLMGEYDVQTEIYYLGKMLSYCIGNDPDFLYKDVLDCMCAYSPSDRYESFFEIKNQIDNHSYRTQFSQSEKRVYLNFINSLSESIYQIYGKLNFNSDDENVLRGLDKVLRNSVLEDVIQDKDSLFKCFFLNDYSPYMHDITVNSVDDFYRLLLHSSKDKRAILLSNVQVRLANRVKLIDDIIPF